jgi:hypothetical protein
MSDLAAEQAALFLGADDDHTYIAIMEDEVGLTDVNWASLRDVGAALSAKMLALPLQQSRWLLGTKGISSVQSVEQRPKLRWLAGLANVMCMILSITLELNPR